MAIRRLRQKGFTFVEIVLTVSILSLGTTLIYQSNLTAVDVYARYIHRLAIQSWADEKIWEAKENALMSESVEAGQSSGEITKNGKDYSWALEIEETEDPDLYLLVLNVLWQEGRTEARLTRAGYVSKIKTQ